MIEIHINNHLYLFEEEKYQTKKYNYIKAETIAFLLNKNINYQQAELYATYYSEMKNNHCNYNQSIINKLKSYGLLYGSN